MNSITWEDSISINSHSDSYPPLLDTVKAYIGDSLRSNFVAPSSCEVEKDPYPIPSPKGREGYYGDEHLSYWVSGLNDSNKLIEQYHKRFGGKPHDFLDFGGASARVARHMLLQKNIPNVWVADLNREHINFNLNVFEGRIKAFQSTSIPHLPIEDNSFDLISAFSVFSHLECFDETWLLELRRILKPNGMLILTANVDTFQDISDKWPVYKSISAHPNFDKKNLGSEIESSRVVFRWANNRSYSSHVFLKANYLMTRWKPFFSELKLVPYFTQFQTGVILLK